MAGLRGVLTLEVHKKGVSGTSNNSRIVNKATTILVDRCNIVTNISSQSMQLPAAAATASFLDMCFLCRQELLPAKDVYMYKGDRGFCSIECRSKQIQMDEENKKLRMMRHRKDNRSVTAMRHTSMS